MYYIADLVDMRLFIKIEDSRSMTAGAKLAHLFLPASARVRQLEQRLGVALLFRQHQGVSLTQAGDVFVRHSRLMTEQMERLHGDLQAFAEGMRGDLRLVVAPTALTSHLADALTVYLLQHPHIRVHLQERLTTDILRTLHDNQADIGIIISGAEDRYDLQTRHYRHDRWVIVVQKGHPLTAAHPVRERTCDEPDDDDLLFRQPDGANRARPIRTRDGQERLRY